MKTKQNQTNHKITSPKQATFMVPRDAHMLDVVLSDVPGGEGTYDNRGGLDYHLPIEGGVGARPQPLHVVHIAVEMAPIAKVGACVFWGEGGVVGRGFGETEAVAVARPTLNKTSSVPPPKTNPPNKRLAVWVTW